MANNPTVATQRLFHLDVLRGIAVLLVLGHHTTATVRIHPIVDALSDALHDMGYLGVDLFFVLSGFLIGGLLLQEWDRTGTLEVGRFLKRRAFKIWPAYLVCLTASCVAYATLDREMAVYPDRYRRVAAAMWPAFFHVQNYCRSTERFVHFWSLGVEEHFYLLLPPILLLILRSTGGTEGSLRRISLLALGLASFCLLLRGIARLAVPSYDGYIHFLPTHMRIDSLVAGVLLAAATRYAPAKIQRFRPWRWPLALAAAAFFTLPALVRGVHPKLFALLYPFDCTLAWLSGMIFVLLAHFADENRHQVGENPARFAWSRMLLAPLAWIGFYSYSIYLWHFYFAPPFSRRILELFGYKAMGTGFSTVVHLALYLIVAIGMGIASFQLIERPWLSLRDRFAPRSPARLTPTEATSEPLFS